MLPDNQTNMAEYISMFVTQFNAKTGFGVRRTYSENVVERRSDVGAPSGRDSLRRTSIAVIVTMP